jgi:hypothetical protein
MSFDLMAFATGFMEHRAEDIKEKKKEARAYKTKQEDQAEANASKVTNRTSTVNKVLGLTKMLESNGATKEQIQAAIASGANGIATFAEKVTAAVEANGGRPLGTADIDTIIRLPSDFTPMDISTQEYVERSFGAYRADKKPIVEPEISFWDRLTGDAAMQQAKYKLGTETVSEGMTASEINAIARQSDYEALIPSTFATFSDFKRFGATERASVEELLLEKTAFLESMDPEYQAAAATIKANPNPVIQEDIEAKKAAMEVVRRKKQESFGSIFEDAITQYGTGAVTGLGDLMTTYMGEDYVETLMSDVAPAVAEGTGQGVSATIENEGGTVETEGNVTSMSHPSVLADPETGEALVVEFTMDEDNTVVSALAAGQTFDGEDAQLIYNSFESFVPSGTVKRGGLSMPVMDVLPENVTSLDVTREEWKNMSRAERQSRGLPVSVFGGMSETFATPEGLSMVELKREASPESYYKLKIAGMPNTFKVKGSDLALIPDQVLVAELGGFTISEFDVDDSLPSKTFSASRLERMFGEGAKLPVTVTSNEEEVDEGVMTSPRPKERPDRRSVREKAIEKFGLTMDDIEEAMDKGEVTESDLQLLVDSGEDMYKYVQENIDPNADEMQYYQLLADWANENKKILPANLNFLVFQLKKVMSDE